MGLMSVGIVLVVVGVILRFATKVHSSGFNIHKLGDILLVLGLVILIATVSLIAIGNRRTTSRRT